MYTYSNNRSVLLAKTPSVLGCRLLNDKVLETLKLGEYKSWKLVMVGGTPQRARK